MKRKASVMTLSGIRGLRVTESKSLDSRIQMSFEIYPVFVKQ